MRVRLLGPVDVVVDGVVRPVRGLRRKAVLAVLALHRGEIVSTDRLIGVVWGGAPPPTAVNTVQSHVSYLRQVLGSKTAVLARPPGYVLDLGADGTDVEAAESLVRQGARSADRADGARQLRAALALWRGRPLVDVAGLAWFEEQAGRLDQLWLHATQALVEVRLALGEHAQLLPELADLVRDHPFDEQLHGQLMLALYGAGRQADALAAYQRLRRTLNDDLGIDPSPALRDLEAAILRQDAALALPAPTITLPAAPMPGSAPVPAQLPLAVRAFGGRDGELADLDALLPGAAQRAAERPGAVVITAVSGTAGVGKTALAVHWAHRVAAHFPDGQLYVNLRGFDPGGPALTPATAVRGFLDAFDVPAQCIPEDLQAQTAMYRSLLAGRRVLVLLDNARDVEQVRPLLPGAAGCLAIVTSRNQLTGLVATEGAHLLTLDVLTPPQARDLLARRLGADRVAGEPAAVDAIIARCARLPLALAIAAARAATHAGFPLAALAAELRENTGALDVLHSDDAATDVRAVFSWSYRTLSPGAARLFRLLGLHPGPDIGALAAASLAGTGAALGTGATLGAGTALDTGTGGPGQVRALLAELARAHLLTEHAPGRYTFHDLLRAYATELTHSVDRDEHRRAATHRMLDHYLHTAHPAALLLNPHRDPIALARPQPGVIPERPADHQQALAWFTAELRVLLAIVNDATCLDTHAWQLAWTLTTFLNRQGHWFEWAATWQVALAAARRLADPSAQAVAHRGLGWAYNQLGRCDEATTQFQHALDLYGKAGDRVGHADIHLDLGRALVRTDRNAQALDHAQQALQLYLAAGHRAGQALALNNIGWCHTLLGEHQHGLIACRQALALHQELGNRDGEAGTWDSLGLVHHNLGQHAEAVACYRRALDLYRDLGDRYEQASTLTNLGDAHQAVGHHAAARETWRRALAILDGLAHPDGDLLRARLRPPSHAGSRPAAAATLA
jgi:DNA-binding SARP family transcriptional activator/Tfp pilus assembly protein PilF